MYCKKCGNEITSSNIYPSDSRFCISCGTERSNFIAYRKNDGAAVHAAKALTHGFLAHIRAC